MNDSIVVFINNYRNVDNFKQLQEIFKYVFVINKHSVGEEVHNLKVDTFVYIKNLDEVVIDDIINCIKIYNQDKSYVIYGLSEQDNQKIKLYQILNKCFNTSLNTNIANIIVFKNNSGTENNLSLIRLNTMNNISKYKNITIKTVLHKKNYGKKEINWSILKFIGTLLSNYFLILLLFVLSFYLSDFNNDLTGIIFANMVSESGGLVINLILHYKSIYINNFIMDNILLIIKFLMRIVLGCFGIYILYNLLSINILLSKAIIDVVLSIILFIIYKIILSQK